MGLRAGASGSPGLLGLRPALPGLQPGLATWTENTDSRRPLAYLPKSSALTLLKAETCLHHCPRSQHVGVGAAVLDLLQGPLPRPSEWPGRPGRGPSRALSCREHCFPSRACWARVSGAPHPREPAGRACACPGAPQTPLLTQTGAASCQQWPPRTLGRRKRRLTWLTYSSGTDGDERALTESVFPTECSRTCHFNMPQGESWGRGNSSQGMRRI